MKSTTDNYAQPWGKKDHESNSKTLEGEIEKQCKRKAFEAKRKRDKERKQKTFEAKKKRNI